jgi:hypothetical protein
MLGPDRGCCARIHCRFRISPNAFSTGCFVLRLDLWSGPFPSGWPEVHQPPPTIDLHSDLLARSGPDRSWRRVTPQISVIASTRMAIPPGWRAISTDSIEIAWSTGFAGVRLRLRIHSDSVAGVAYAFHDNIGPVEPTANVSGARVPCLARAALPPPALTVSVR